MASFVKPIMWGKFIIGRRALLAAIVVILCSGRTSAWELTWRNLGPAGGGGRVAAVAGSDADPLLYYLASAGGGVFKTTNGGLTWNDVWPRSSVGATGAVTIAPSNKNVVWVGTGESTPRNDASYGNGVWVTRDGGAHWMHRGLPYSYAIARILIDPTNADVALVGALGNPFRDSRERGVFRTVDGGRTWRHTLYVGPQSGVSDLALDRLHPSTVYAGIWKFRRTPWTFTSGGPQDGIYKSSNGGLTWRRLTGGGLPTGIMGRIGLAVASSDSRRVYALIQSKRGLLWRSDDAGAHWRLMSRDTILDQRPFYLSRLEVDPSDENRVLFASEDLMETRNGGASFREVASAVHQDHHGFWISRDGRRIIEADDGGAPISVDGGANWDWRFNTTLAQVYHVGYSDENPYSICAALQDNDSFCGPSLSLSPLGLLNSDWRDVANDSDGVWAWPEPGNPGAVWNVGVNELNGQLGIFDLANRQNYDITPDVTDTNGRPLAGLPHRFNWEAPVAFSEKEPGVAYFGGNVVFETRDRGKSWTVISPDLTRNDPAKQQVAGGPINADVSGAEFYDTLLDIAPSPIDANVIWTGSDDGVISRTIDHGLHWQNVTPAWAAPWGRIEAVEPSHVSADRAYAAIDRHLVGDRRPYIVATGDGGRSWQPIGAGLPQDQMARVVREDPTSPNLLFAGLEQGVWYSLDRGAHWRSLQLNMPPVSVHDLRITPRTSDLIAGTHGRGIFILDDLAPLEGLAVAQATVSPTLFKPRAAYAWYYWWVHTYGTRDSECCAPSGEFSAPDPAYGALISYYLPHAFSRGVSIEILDAAGRIVRWFATSGAQGLNRTAWDLAEAAPAAWTNTGMWNQGPATGPPVVPGRYTVRLRAGTQVFDQPVDVLSDPRARWTQEQYVSRYEFLKALDDELSMIDTALNTLDRMKKKAPANLQNEIAGVYTQFTSGIVNSEDDQWKPDQLRERLTILQGTVALSQGPPLAPHYREAIAVRQQFDRAMAAYQRFLEGTHP